MSETFYISPHYLGGRLDENGWSIQINAVSLYPKELTMGVFEKWQITNTAFLAKKNHTKEDAQKYADDMSAVFKGISDQTLSLAAFDMIGELGIRESFHLAEHLIGRMHTMIKTMIAHKILKTMQGGAGVLYSFIMSDE